MKQSKKGRGGFVGKIREKAKHITKRLVSHHESDDVFISKKLEPTSDNVQNVDVSKQGFPIIEFSIEFWVIGAIVVILLITLYQALPVIILIFAAFIISVAMEGPVRQLQRRGFPRWGAMSVVYFLVVVIVIAIIMVIPFVIVQLGTLVSVLIHVFQGIQGDIQTMGWSAYISSREYLPGAIKSGLLESFNDPVFVSQIQSQLSALIGTWQTWATSLTSYAWQVAAGFIMTLGKVSLVWVLAIFFSLERESVLNFIVKTLSKRKSDSYDIHRRVVMMYSKLQLRLKGQLFLMLYIGGAAYLGFWIMSAFGLDIDKKELLALMAAVTEIIPYLGPFMGAIPAILVAGLAHGWMGALVVVIIFGVLQRTEGNIIVPVVMNRVLGVSSLLIFICMILGGWLFGFVGVLFAVPISVIVAVVMNKEFGIDNELKTKKKLG